MALIATFHELEKPLNEQGGWLFPCYVRAMVSRVLAPLKLGGFQTFFYYDAD